MRTSNVKKLYLSGLIIAMSGVLLFLSLASPIVLNTSDFSIYNTGWNGCSRLAVETYETGKFTPLLSYNTSSLTPIQQSFVSYECIPSNTSICIIGPQNPFTKEETNYIDWFLTEGGIVFMADDFGSGNSLLEQLNTTTRLSNQLLLDFSFEKNVSFSRLYNFYYDEEWITRNVSRIVTNYPSSINASKNATILADSSNFSWLDSTYNWRYDDTEEKGPYPVISREPYGNGILIVCSDPSIFINSMQSVADNLVLIDDLLTSVLHNRSSIILDESHRDVSVPFTIAVRYPNTIDTTIKIAILILITMLYLVFFTPLPTKLFHFISIHVPLFRTKKTETSTASLLDEILNEHPQWDKKTLELLLDSRENKHETT